jgi:hypothetical protein
MSSQQAREHLTLDPEEADILRDVLIQYLADLRVEIGDTESHDLRVELHRREAVLQQIVGRIEQQSQARADGPP